MNRHDVIRHMGRFPDAINPPQRMMGKVWKCSTCGDQYEFTEPVKIPAPCERCQGISFVKHA